MAERLCTTSESKAAVAGGGDRLSALPEDVIRLVLSFLPSEEAVQTCLLATRWRNLWKSVPSLRIYSCCYGTDDFIDSLLRYRDRDAPLHECEILVEADCSDELHRNAERWLRYVVSHKVRVLRFDMLNHADGFPLSAGPLVSEHSTRLDLFRVGSKDLPLDVSGCQSLEELEIRQSAVDIGSVGTRFPKSLRLLRIRDVNFLPKDTWSSISAPGLLTLELVDCLGKTPFLSMPSLVTALIGVGHDCGRSYYCNACGGVSCPECYGIDVCVLLKGLSSAMNLELMGLSSMIFRREIKWCPTFSNLKTLLLGDWFMTANFSGLVCFLRHSPVLEMLQLRLSIFSKEIETSQVYKPKKQFLVSKHLKAVEIICCEGVGKIDQILNVLAYHGVKPELISIEREPSIGCFSCNTT
ncbi:putative F-box/FBD/LRR-repeat protein At1g78760 [Triticum dicoccoides]|uniref:putative F-box/FBD/LRR-repeat protein At1g78760 n=1 Tax=Triticum dicoccoides TaxID=85692 RepID=UPI001890825F|nr:putative F-box/FBD/LRR-repeat protein At1g78760 [Triticum dicoccoides]